MRLIDADEFRELIDGGYDLNFDDVPNTKKELLRMIDDAPTVSPDMAQVLAYEYGKVKRKRGKWIDLGKDRVIRWQCSECEIKDTHIYNYCPSGAEMRGEANEILT